MRVCRILTVVGVCAALIFSMGCAGELSTYEVHCEDSQYSYVIRSQSGDVILAEDGLMREPHIHELGGGVVSVSVQAGTGVATRQTVYCDTSTGRRSETYTAVLGEQRDKVFFVHYADGAYCIVMQDLFDKKAFYKEFPLEDASAVTDPVREFELTEAGTARLVYLKGVDYTETEMTLELH